ncbi:MAG TPA: response regulator transcription factor [Thermoanaerobaculia bacterium]|nr:response regulator transcription factor [Thermoanaerobaculia bacterium]
MTRIVIADDHAVVRKGLRLILADAEGIEVAGEAASADELLTLLRSKRADAVILDVALGDRDGIEVLKHIRSEFLGMRVLMISVHAEEVFAIRAFRAGADGYIEKSAPVETLRDAIARVAAGGTYMSAAVAERLKADLGRGGTHSLPHERLSDREFEVFRLLGSGKSVTEIAHALNLTVKTVSTHRTHIVAKTGLATNAEIVDYVTLNGLR